MLIRLYQLTFGPWTGSSCRFYPSCSEYAKFAIEKYGAANGSWLAIKRILRCHPWHPGGADPVP
jgi:putative membrane protein insertion efficiency factor